MAKRTTPFLVLCCALLSGCWVDGERYESPVFSDDAGSVAAVYLAFETRKGMANDPERDHAIQVLTAEGTEPWSLEPLTDLLEGRPVDLFFMHSQGYVLLGREGPELELGRGESETDIWYDQIALDGTITALGEGRFQTQFLCTGAWSSGWGATWPIRFIPSPDGTMLAKFESETSCTAQDLWVTLLDAADLTELAGPFEVPDLDPDVLGAGPPFAEVTLGWTEDDAFAVGLGADGGVEEFEATLYRVDADPETGVSMTSDCFKPPTTSGDTNAAGDTLVLDEETGEIEIDPEEWGRTFGCD